MNLFDAWPEKITPEGEAALLEQITQAKLLRDAGAEASAREELVLCSMREGYAYAKHFGRSSFDDWQIVSLAYEALRRAAKNFKPGFKSAGCCRFFAYAKPYVRGEVCRAYRMGDVVPRMTRVPMEIPPRENQETGVASENIPEIGGSEEMDFDGMHWSELWAKLEPHLKDLTEKEQSVISDYRDGMNFREMGDKRGVSRAAMQSTFARALGKLRKAMGVE